MRCKLDENVPLAVAGVLRAAGHDVHSVHDEALAGTSDAALLAACQAEGRALLTLDLDFADLRSYPPEVTAGLVVLRPGSQDVPHLVRLVERLLPLFAAEPLAGRLWIVDDERVRVRGT